MKDTYIKLRCTTKQKELIQNVSNKLGMSVTDYMLSRCVPTKHTVPTVTVPTDKEQVVVPTVDVPTETKKEGPQEKEPVANTPRHKIFTNKGFEMLNPSQYSIEAARRGIMK